MVETSHVLNQVTDYVLGLLPQKERLKIEQHAAVCYECRLAIRRESQIGLLVRSSLTAVPKPERRHLNDLMPPAPKQRHLGWRLIWQNQVAPVALLLIVLIGGWGIWQTNQNSIWTGPAPTYLAATATITDVPTATIAEVETAGSGEMIHPLQTLVATVPVQPAIIATPAPNPTPVAAASQAALSN